MLEKPKKLPFCSFPTAADINSHGRLGLPDKLPRVDMTKALDFRSRQYSTIPFSKLSLEEIDKCARLIATSFVANEPMNKHMITTEKEPAVMKGLTYQDEFGGSQFGPITQSNMFYWFVRLFLLTEVGDKEKGRQVKKNIVDNSYAIKSEFNDIIGVALADIMKVHHDSEEESLHPFGDFVSAVKAPILDVLHQQDAEAIESLCEKYPTFSAALELGKVGAISMIAKGDELPSEDAFELFAVPVEHFQNLGFEYIVTAASNNWTGAACELINGVRAYFYPYRLHQIRNSDLSWTPDGFLSYKDSGIMFYIMKI